MSDAMTGPRHWAEAERLLADAARARLHTVPPGASVADAMLAYTHAVAEAQVHATLALTAATFERTNSAGNAQAWLSVLSAGTRGTTPKDAR